jgi:hypothetical protein
MPNAWVTLFEEQLMQSFRRIAEEIGQAFPQVVTNVWSSPVGSATSLQGHNMGVECLIQDAPLDVADNVALSIDLAYLTSQPQLTGADVCWGHPSGCLEAELTSGPLDLTEAVVEQVKAGLPTLEAALKAAVARGTPSR